MHIILQPVSHIPDDVLDVLKELPEIFSVSFHVDESIELPSHTFDRDRKQYISPSILEFIQERCVSHDKVLCICDVDAYSDGLNFVFGEAINGICANT